MTTMIKEEEVVILAWRGRLDMEEVGGKKGRGK